MDSMMKGFSVTVESVLMIGGVVAAALFFASFYTVVMHQADSAVSISEEGFARELEKRIDQVYLSSADAAEVTFNAPASSYTLEVTDGKATIMYVERMPVYVLSDANMRDAIIKDEAEICIAKKGGEIIFVKGKCAHKCDMDDEICDKGCAAFGVSDQVCK